MEKLSTEMKVFDTHVHTLKRNPVKDSIKSFESEFEYAGIQKVAFMCILRETEDCLDPLNNLKGLFYKKYFSPDAYAYASLDHKTHLSDTEQADDFLHQAEVYMSAGFDGMKLLEGKPTLRKFFGKPLSSPIYDKFFAYMEECGKPLTLHNADPESFWDRTKMSPLELARGWLVDETQLTKEEMFRDVMAVMKRYPRLKLTLAHYGFTTDNIKDAEEFLGEYEFTALDTTPGGGQYFNMLANKEIWIPFLEKYSNRIKYGSDTYNEFCEEQDNLRNNLPYRPALVHNFFETDTYHTYNGKPYKGIKLDKSILQKIFFENAINELGNPEPIDMNFVRSETERLEALVKDPFDIADLKFIRENF